VHTPCCTGWGFESGETLAMAKLAIETGLWVNYEMVDGRVEKAKKVRRKPVEEYLAKQKRFRHLFKPARQDDVIAHIQAVADANAERFGIDIKAKESSE
jgi:pyruvate ferredoxin oxidoreductase beta subunit